MNRNLWLGGSDIAAILGISPYKTPLILYLEKTGQGEQEDKPVFKRGQRWEPVARDMLLDKIEREEGSRPELIATNRRYVDNHYSFLSCEIDAEVNDRGRYKNVEIKTVDPRMSQEWGEEHSEEIPIHYAAQTMFGLGITGREHCIVGAMFGLDEDKLLRFYVERDDETIRGMREKAVEFWRKHVLERIPPDPINMEDMMRLFAKHNGRPCEINEETYQKIVQRKDIKEQIKLLEKQADEMEFDVCDFVRRQWGAESAESITDDAVLTFGDSIAGTWKKQRGTHLDQKKLAEEHPEIIEKYTKEHWFRVLRKKGK